MEPGDVKIALRSLVSACAAFLRRRDRKWLTAAGISFLVHLLLMPVVFFFILRFEKPRSDRPVFMLSGGLHVHKTKIDDDEEIYAREQVFPGEELEEEGEDDDDIWDDEEAEIEKEVLERLAEEREEIFSLPVTEEPSISMYEIEDEEDEDWQAVLDEIADEDETEVEILDEPGADTETAEEEEVEEAGEGEAEARLAEAGKEDAKKGKQAPGPKHWEHVFAESAPEGKPQAKSEADRKIESLMEINPYDDKDLASIAAPPLENLVAGSFFGEGEAQLPDLLLWLPPDIKMAGLVSLSLLRSRPDREVFENTFRKLPYFDSIAGGSDMDFFQQIDAVLIATYDPFAVEETYLMLRHNLDEKMIRKAVSKHFRSLEARPNWYRISGKDVVQPSKKHFEKIPWVYFFPKDKIVGIVHISKRESIKTLMDTPGSAQGGAAHLVGPLERLMRFGYGMPEGAREEEELMTPGIVVGSVQFDEMMAVLNRKKKFPLPVDTMVVGRFGEEHVSVEGTARFTDLGDPRRFIERWKEVLDPIKKHKIIKILGIDKILDFPVWSDRDDGNLTLQALVPSERVEPLLALIRLITGGEKKTVEKHVKPEPKKKKQ